VIVPEPLVRDGAGLVRLIGGESVTHVQATPSGWRILLDGGLGSGEERERVVALSGGEGLPLPLAREIRGRVRRLFNGYGPTETTVYSTMAELPDPVDQVTIGTPIANTQTYLLDEHMSLARTGELHIGGAGVTAGYLGRPELTAQRFVAYGGGWVYRTGDLCRRLPGGQLIYLGRIDGQVKLRGHRIELGEIETALLDCPGVRQAAVALRDGRLVGYLVGEPPSEQDLRERLVAVLPAVMVPAAWMVVDHLPLTPNGKLDRTALPDLPATRPHQTEPTTPHTDPVTDRVRAIWEEVLQLGHIDLDEDLLALGGDSLTIARIVARVRRQFGVTLPMKVCFNTPTIAELAMVINRMAGAGVGELGSPEGAAADPQAANWTA
jgi:acyl-coenzyme A synthetase/AMP-(fatty) acid ligase/acyl carrier protein